MKKIITIVLFAILLYAPSARGAAVFVALDATWPPMEFLDENNKVVGFDVDFMRAVAKEAGFEVVFLNVPWDDLFAGLQVGKYDAVCSSVTITGERAMLLDFSLPYFWDRKVRQALVVPLNSAMKSLGEMQGMTLGVQNDTTGYLAVNRAGGVVARPYRNIHQAMDDLSKGLIDGVVCDDPVAANYLQEHKEAGGRVKIAGLLETGDEYYGVAVRKGNRRLLDLINQGIEAVQAKGIDIELRARWMGK